MAEKLLVYSGRKEELIGPLLEQAEEALGFDDRGPLRVIGRPGGGDSGRGRRQSR